MCRGRAGMYSYADRLCILARGGDPVSRVSRRRKKNARIPRWAVLLSRHVPAHRASRAGSRPVAACGQNLIGPGVDIRADVERITPLALRTCHDATRTTDAASGGLPATRGAVRRGACPAVPARPRPSRPCRRRTRFPRVSPRVIRAESASSLTSPPPPSSFSRSTASPATSWTRRTAAPSRA